MKINGDADHYNHRDGNDDYCQPRALYELFDKEQKTRLYMNIAQAMQGVPQVILEKQLAHFEKIANSYAQGIKDALQTIN